MPPHTTRQHVSPAAPRPSAAPARRRALAALLGATLVVAGLTACSKDKPDAATWPDGAQVVADAATAISDISSVHITIDLDPALGNPAIKRADLDLTAAGDSKGEVEMQLMGTAITTAQLVTLGATPAKPKGASYVFFTGLGWIEYDTLSETYDTSAILDPDRGLPKMLSTATEAKTVDSEEVGGVDTWKVSIVFDNKTIEALVATELGDSVLSGNLWIAKDTHFLAKAEVHVPDSPGTNPESEVTMTTTNFNAPLEITAPVL